MKARIRILTDKEKDNSKMAFAVGEQADGIIIWRAATLELWNEFKGQFESVEIVKTDHE